MKRGKWTAPISFPAVLILVVTLLAPGQAPAVDRSGETVPFFTAETVEGREFDLRSLAGTNPVLIFFWNRHKASAIREMNFLNIMNRYYQLYGLEIAAVEGSIRNRDQVREDLEKLRIIGTAPEYSILPDPDGSLAAKYRVAQVPETFLVGRGGKVLFHLSGFDDGDGVDLERAIKKHLGLVSSTGPARTKTLTPPAPTGPRDIFPKTRVTVDPEQQLYEKYRYFGNYYYNLGNLDKAEEQYLQALEIDPKAVEIHLRLGEIAAMRKDFAKAREAWEDVLRIEPDNREADNLIRKLIRGEF